jgi:hypothetical protein
LDRRLGGPQNRFRCDAKEAEIGWKNKGKIEEKNNLIEQVEVNKGEYR